MAIDQTAVEYAAHLARIDLGELELKKLSAQLQDILGFIDKLKKIDVTHTKPTSHILPINSVLRDDVPRDSLPIAKVLENAPQKAQDFFCVPKIIE